MSEEKEAEKKRRVRPVRVALIGLASLVLLAAALLVLVRVGTFDRPILKEASRRLEAASGLRLAADEITVNPFNLSVRLEKPSLKAVEGRGPILREFTADTLFLDVPRSLIFGGNLRFQRILVVCPAVLLAPLSVDQDAPIANAELIVRQQGRSSEKAQGRTNPNQGTQTAGVQRADLSSRANEPARFKLRIDELDVEDGEVSWRGRPETINISLSEIDLAVDYDTAAQLNVVSFTASGGHLTYQDNDLDLTRLDLKGRFGPESIEVETLEIATPASSSALSGTITDYAAVPRISARARLSLSLLEMPFLASLVPGAEGILSAEASASGKPGNLSYNAVITTIGLKARDFGSGSLTGHVHGDSASLTLSDLDFRTDAGAISGKLTADLRRKALAGVDLEWKDLDPDRFQRLLPILEKIPVSFGSLVNGRLVGKASSLSLEGIEGSAFLTLTPKPSSGHPPSGGAITPAQTLPSGPPKPSLRPSAEIALRAAAGDIILDTGRLTAAGAFLQLSGELRPDGELDGRYGLKVESVPGTIEALRLLGNFIPFIAGPGFDPEMLSGSISVTGEVRGQAGKPAFTAFLDIPEIGYRGVRAESLRAGFEWTIDHLSVRDLSATAAGGTVRASGSLFLGKGQGGAAPGPDNRAWPISIDTATGVRTAQDFISGPASSPFLLTLELENIHLAEAASLLPEPWKRGVEGLFAGKAEIATGPAGLTAVFSAEATNLATGFITPTPTEPADEAPLRKTTDDKPPALPLRIPRLKFDGTCEASRLNLNDLLVETEAGPLSGMGGYDLKSGTFSASLRSEGIGLEIFRSFLPTDFSLGGRAAIDIDARGDFAAPRGTIILSVTDLRAGSFAVPSLSLNAKSDGSTADVSLRLPDYSTILDAKLALAPPFPIEGRLSAASFPLDRLIHGTPDTALATMPAPADNISAGTSAAGAKSASLLDLDASFGYALADPSAFSAELTFSGKGLSFGPSESLSAPESSSPLAVSIAGRARASGDPTSPATLALNGELSHLLLVLGDKSLTNSEGLRFRLAEGTFHFDSLVLAGTGGSLSLSGTIGPFPGTPTLDGRIHTDIDLAALSPLIPGMLIGGRLKADLDVRGESAGPSFSGHAALSEAFVRTEDFPLILSGLTGSLSLKGSRLTLDRLEGTANGGPLRIQGALDGLVSALPPSGRFTIDVRNFQLEYPPGLHTTSDIAFTLTGADSEWVLAGDMRILRGLFREDITPGGQLLGLGAYRWARSDTELPAFIRTIGLDIAVDTAEPIVFKNNLAEVEIMADLRVSGNPGLPLFSGRMQNAAVGEIVFSERRFVLETARVDLLGQRVPDPNLEIVAHTSITHNLEPLDVQLRLSGPSSDLRYSLTSTPPRSKEDLSLILLTGRSLEEVRGNAVDTLTTQTIQFFSSPIASPITRTLERALKIEDISFEPLLISSEADPGARFTFRKKISEEVAVTYSIDITSTQDQTILLDYRLKRNFVLQAFRKDNGSYGASLRHSVPLWLGWPRPAGTEPGIPGGRPILTELTFESDPNLPSGEVSSAFRRLEKGEPFSYSTLSDAIDRLARTYKKMGYANADIRPSVTTSEDGTEAEVHLVFNPGNPVRLVYSGDGISARTRRAVRRQWTGLLPEDVNLDEARRLILEKLHRKGHYAARAETGKREAENESVYEISVTKDPRYSIRNFYVDGNEALETPAIRKAASDFPLAEYKGLWNLVHDPAAAIDAVLAAYRDLGHSEARAGRPRVSSDPAARAVDIRIAVEEGPQRMVGGVAFEGNEALDEVELGEVVTIAKGKPYDPSLLPKDEDTLLALCRSRGFREAQVKAEAVKESGGTDVDIVFKIREGSLHTVGSLEVTGAKRTRDKLVLKTARIEKGDVFSFESLAMGQKRLYDLGVFRAVNISTPERGPGREGERENTDENSATDVPVVLDVREEPPLTFTYGLRYNSEDKLEGQVELALVNLLGGGRTGYLSYRQSSRVWDARLSIKLPYVLGFRADTRFSLSATRERREAYISDELSGTVGQEAKFLKSFNFSVFYRLSRVRERAPEATEFGPSIFISEFSLNFIRDTRDDRFDAKSGSFLSLSVTGAPRIFGSELPYGRIFTQYSVYKNVWRKVLWASNVRFGATEVFGGEELLASRLFYAGGGTSIRGFAQDRVGPIDPVTGLPTGGKFVFIVNQELRVPLFFWFSGVVFYDLGNVYPTFRSLIRLALRQGVGAGLRAESPIGLIRFDVGFNPFRREGESSTVLFLSIGQAF